MMAENFPELQGGKKKSTSTHRVVKIQNTKVQDLKCNREKTWITQKNDTYTDSWSFTTKRKPEAMEYFQNADGT